MKANKPKEENGRYLPVMGGAFLLGVLAGSLICSRMPFLQQWLEGRWEQPLTFWPAVWPSLALLAAVGMSAFFRGGYVTVLLALAAKGFLLAAEATALVLQMGNQGYLYGLARCFLPGFFSLAAMVLLGRQSAAWAARRTGPSQGRRRGPGPDGVFAITFVICTGLTLASAGLELWLSPKLWNVVQSFLPMV